MLRYVAQSTAVAVLLGLGTFCAPALAQMPAASAAAMKTIKVSELGIEVAVEPRWDTELTGKTGHPTFAVSTPEGIDPVTVMMYSSWPKERVAAASQEIMATTAIRRASRNFGLTKKRSEALAPVAATYGELKGYEAGFAGVGQNLPMAVKIFVGQGPNNFPVVLTIYAFKGKQSQLDEPIRRAWSKVKYLPR